MGVEAGKVGAKSLGLACGISPPKFLIFWAVENH